ncbi:hypothetical protein M7I_2690 [Glarea lozoyensis 74030]|uniref:Uncharacterized protein n=1 Tax=Glarea lozoyensis (strain ATCC 74030 / MF5533) TaxID=1104152 RepID=H0EJG4_GLAL7|nr:hypothetical protein M7I_2690 [Glarea lozoyensis 74030]
MRMCPVNSKQRQCVASLIGHLFTIGLSLLDNPE